MIFVLQNIRSAWNVGSIFRTADAVGASIICLGYTATPDGHASKQIIKTAIGAEKTVLWSKQDTIVDIDTLYPKNIYTHLAIEISDTSASLFDYLQQNTFDTEKICLWFGNEIAGIDQSALEYCDHILHLPMQGLKESLNVSNVVTATAYLCRFREASSKVLK